MAQRDLLDRSPLTSRERVRRATSRPPCSQALPDRVPLDLGSSAVTGMQASSVHALRCALGLSLTTDPIKVIEPYQMLGEIGTDLQNTLGVDVVPLGAPRTMFGFKTEGWKPWTFHDGTPLLVPELFNTTPDPESGYIYQYAEGDKCFPPSGRMPQGGWYFDSTSRQDPLPEDDSELRVEDNLEEFVPVSQGDLNFYFEMADDLYRNTNKSILFSPGGLAFGDIALVPAPWLKHPRGIRDVAEWYMSTAARKKHVMRIFEGQCKIGLDNLERLHHAVGERIQTGTLISPRAYREMYQPFHKKINDWIHAHTTWKTFIHCCGSCVTLIEDFITAGFDILNPVQCSATGMDSATLKKRFGERIVFWGGGVDTQNTLSFGTAEQVRAEIRERISIFGQGGGFVWNPTHNVQSRVPVQNLLAMYETVREAGVYK